MPKNWCHRQVACSSQDSLQTAIGRGDRTLPAETVPVPVGAPGIWASGISAALRMTGDAPAEKSAEGTTLFAFARRSAHRILRVCCQSATDVRIALGTKMPKTDWRIEAF